jgi:hypothetical protein
MPLPKHTLRGLPQLGRAIDARLRSAGRSTPPAPLPASRGSIPRQPLGLPTGTGRAPLSTLRGGGTPGGGGLPGGAAAGDPYGPAYPEEFPAPEPPSVRMLFQSYGGNASVADSLAETSLGLAGRGDLTLPAGFFAGGRGIELTLAGSYYADMFASSGYTCLLRLYLGGVPAFSLALPTGPFTSCGRWSARLRLICWSTGSGAVFSGHGELLGQGSPFADPVPGLVLCWDYLAPELDTADALAIDITAQHDEALPGNSTGLDDFAVLQLF